MGFYGFGHGFPAFGSDLGGIWVVFGLAFDWLDLGSLVVIFFRWVEGFVPMGLMVGFSIC